VLQALKLNLTTTFSVNFAFLPLSELVYTGLFNQSGFLLGCGFSPYREMIAMTLFSKFWILVNQIKQMNFV